jgi:hypothetical protein
MTARRTRHCGTRGARHECRKTTFQNNALGGSALRRIDSRSDAGAGRRMFLAACLSRLASEIRCGSREPRIGPVTGSEDFSLRGRGRAALRRHEGWSACQMSTDWLRIPRRPVRRCPSQWRRRPIPLSWLNMKVLALEGGYRDRLPAGYSSGSAR